MIHFKNEIPQTKKAWLEEIARAYREAYETIPFGIFVDQEINPKDLFHLAPSLCLKFRGIKRTKKNLKKATDAALASYVATEEAIDDLFDIPQMTFAFAYVASHYGLELIDQTTSTELLDYIETNLDELLDLTDEQAHG